MSHLCDTGNGRKCVLTPLHKAIVMTLGDETPGEDENMNRYWLVVVSDWQKISDGATRFVASACMWITATRGRSPAKPAILAMSETEWERSEGVDVGMALHSRRKTISRYYSNIRIVPGLPIFEGE